MLPQGSRYAELEGSIEWLIKSGLVHKVPIYEEATVPLGANENERRFKMHLMDVGLLGAMIGMEADIISRYEYGTYKGYFAENFVLQELVANGFQPGSWARNTSEVEFVLERNEKVIPIEVKSGLNAKAKSLKVFLSRYTPDSAFLMSAIPIQSFSPLPIQLPMYLTPKIPLMLLS